MRAAVVFLGLLSVALITGSLPRFIATYNASYGSDVLDRMLDHGEIPTPQEFELAIGAFEISLGWSHAASTQQDIATIYAVRSFSKLAQGEAAEQDIEQSKKHLRRLLLANPSSHLGWTMLAELELMGKGSVDNAVAMLARSYRVAPLDFDNSMSRLAISLQLLPELDLATIGLVERETVAMARFRTDELAILAVELGLADTVRVLLERSRVDETVIEEFVVQARRLLGRA